jgi:hypothetical protein
VTAAAGSSFLRRMWRAARIDSHVFEEVEADKRALPQAALVVVLASTAGGLGSWIAGGTALLVGIDLFEPLVLWLGGAAFTYMVGATFLRGPHTITDYAEVLRTTGFAFAPGILRGLIAVPPPELGSILTYAADAWMLVAGIVAVRQALDFTTARAIATFGLSYALLYLALGGVFVSVPV